jgi:uncharacterized protein YdhG (YjbR/CyaY superfamily)
MPTIDDATQSVDEMLADLPDDRRAALAALRSIVAATAPDAVDAVSYGMPAFRYRGRPLVGYHAAKDHLAFFPMSPGVLDRHRTELAAFDLAKGTIRFQADRPIPIEVVTAIVRDRMAEIDLAMGSRRR